MASRDDYLKLMGDRPLPFLMQSEVGAPAPGDRPLPYQTQAEADPYFQAVDAGKSLMQNVIDELSGKTAAEAQLARAALALETGTLTQGPSFEQQVGAGLREGVELFAPSRGINRLWTELKSPPMRPQPEETVDLKLQDLLAPPGFPPLPFDATVKVPRLADLIAGAVSDVAQQALSGVDLAAVAHSVRGKGYDAVVGYGVGRKVKEPFISEVFDVREDAYPTKFGGYSVHPDFKMKKESSILDDLVRSTSGNSINSKEM